MLQQPPSAMKLRVLHATIQFNNVSTKIRMLSSHFAFTIVAAAKVRFETGIVIQGYLGGWTFKILKLRFLKVRQASIII